MIIFRGNKLAVKIGGASEPTNANGKAIEVATETEMTTILTNATAIDNGKVYKYTGETGTYENGSYYVLNYEV